MPVSSNDWVNYLIKSNIDSHTFVGTLICTENECRVIKISFYLDIQVS